MNKTRTQIVNELFNQGDRLSIADPVYKQWVFRYTFLELEKDLGKNGDITTDGLSERKKNVTARIYANTSGIVAGVSEINYFLAASNPLFKPGIKKITITQEMSDGSEFHKDDVLLECTGRAQDILKVERVVLNLLQHMSGIAKQAKAIIKQAKKR